MLSSAQRLVEAACEATSPSTNDVEERLKEMYLNLGILVADIVFAAFGLTGRLAGSGIRLADTYILGFLKKKKDGVEKLPSHSPRTASVLGVLTA